MDLQETAYPRLNPDPSPRDLEIYSVTRAEMSFARHAVKRPAARIALFLHLKVVQRLGYFIRLDEIPPPIRQHILHSAGVKRPPSLAELRRFDQSGTRQGVVEAVRRHLGIRPLDSTGKTWLTTAADKAAETKNTVPDVINVMLEELVHHRYELPAFSTLQRMAFAARERVNDRNFSGIVARLDAAAKRLIDELLSPQPGSRSTGWQLLKREIRRPTKKEVRDYLQHISRLRHLADRLPPVDIPMPKLKQYRLMARALDASEMAELQPRKRYALAVIFIRAQYAQTLDDTADLFIKLMQKLENSAREALIAHQLDRANQTDALILQLRELLLAYRLDGTDNQRLDAIGGALSADIDDLVAQCDAQLAYAGRNYFPFLLKPYQALRSQLLNCVEVMAPKTSSDDATIERMIAALQVFRATRRDTIPLAEISTEPERDFEWMTQTWQKLVFVKADGQGQPERVNRKYFELAVLQQIKDELKSGDLYVENGERYNDYREQLVDLETFRRELAEYGEVTGLSTDPSEFCDSLKKALSDLAREVDEQFPKNAQVEIVQGRLVLHRPERTEPSAEVKKVEAEIDQRIEATGILDVLVDAERWLDLHRYMRPLAGTASKIEDLRQRFVATLFCFGCNLGASQTARAVKGFSRKQVAWLNLKYLSEESLDKAIVKVINAYNQFDLPRHWGSGKHASADGTKWGVYEQNLLSEYHIRYGGYGGIGYYHVSDKYIALFSHFIPCGVHEGTYILDGLMANESDIRPDTVHGDTHAQSYPVFALAHLLGIQLMPRIRGIKDLILYRPDARYRYDNINGLFSNSIDWKLIKTHLHDMMRVAVSVKTGKITASTILRRLGTYSRKNKLYFAFRELGKVLRTMFLLNYISDVELRRVIHAATNKSEQLNGFLKWSFFGGDGIIPENIRHEQRKVIKYNQLVANMVIFHNVVSISRVLRDLQEEGFEITPEIAAGLAPYRIGHINRFGDYLLNVRKRVAPLDFDMLIIA